MLPGRRFPQIEALFWSVWTGVAVTDAGWSMAVGAVAVTAVVALGALLEWRGVVTRPEQAARAEGCS